MEKNAAPPYEKTSAASAALFQSNLEYILHQRRLAWAQSDVPESSWQLYHALWSEAIDVYFGDLALALRNKPTLAVGRCQARAHSLTIDDSSDRVVIPEAYYGHHILHAETFFHPFFQGAMEVYDSGANKSQAKTVVEVLAALSLAVLARVFALEAASFLPAASDTQSRPKKARAVVSSSRPVKRVQH